MFSISDFNAIVQRREGVVQPNRYAVYIQSPQKIPGNFKSDDLNLLAETVSVPSRSIATADQRTNGPMRKIARESIYGEMAMEFVLTNDFLAKNYFDAWMVAVQNDHGYGNSYYDDYIGTIWFNSIPSHLPYEIPVSTNGSPEKFTVKIEEAYPISTGELSYGYANRDTYLKLQVTFAYRRWINTNLMNGITGKPVHANLYE